MTTLVHDVYDTLFANEYADRNTEHNSDYESTHEIWIESSGYES